MNDKIQIHMINQAVGLIGFNYMFPFGSKVWITKRVDDAKAGKSVFQGHFHNDLTGTGHDVQFDAKTGHHLSFDPDDAFSCYNVKLDLSAISA